MKYFLCLSTLFFLETALPVAQGHAAEGIVIVLDAPLLKAPAKNSTVLQTLRKGSRIFIPRKFAEMPTQQLPPFIPTFDRAGNRAYVPTEYLKFITGDAKEANQPIALEEHDPTDYRIEEPIPLTYPYDNVKNSRASISFLLGNNTKSPYDYDRAFNSQSYQAEMGARAVVTYKFDRQDDNRFYYGFIGSISNSANRIEFKNDQIAKESRALVRGGPFITFDTFRNPNYRFSLGAGFTFNYHRSAISTANQSVSEELLFSGVSLSPIANATLQMIDVIPEVDFICGIDLSLFLPHTQKTSYAIDYPELWGSGGNQIKSGFVPQVSLFLGSQLSF